MLFPKPVVEVCAGTEVGPRPKPLPSSVFRLSLTLVKELVSIEEVTELVTELAVVEVELLDAVEEELPAEVESEGNAQVLALIPVGVGGTIGCIIGMLSCLDNSAILLDIGGRPELELVEALVVEVNKPEEFELTLFRGVGKGGRGFCCLTGVVSTDKLEELELGTIFGCLRPAGTGGGFIFTGVLVVSVDKLEELKLVVDLLVLALESTKLLIVVRTLFLSVKSNTLPW